MSDKMTQQTHQQTQAEVKASKRAAALRDNLKKRKALSKEKKNAHSKDSQ